VGLSSPGIGSNLDVNGIVSKLMSVEQQPLTLLAQKEASFQAKISAYGSLSGALSSFQNSLTALSTPTKFQAISANVTDSTVLTASATSNAVTGSYNVNVSQLAQAQTITGAGQASATATIGSGASTTITFQFGTISGGSFISNGANLSTTAATGGIGANSLTLNGTTIVTNGTTTSAKALATQINLLTSTTGVTATANTTDTGVMGFTPVATGAGDAYSLVVGTTTLGNIGASSTFTAADLDSAVTANAAALAAEGITATGTAVGGNLHFTKADGTNFNITQTLINTSGTATGGVAGLTSGTAKTYTSSVSLSSASAITVGGTNPSLAGLNTGIAPNTFSGATFTQDSTQATGTVTIDSTNNSLQGIRDAINKANVGVTASIISDGSSTPAHLVLTSSKTGATSSMRITVAAGNSALSNVLSYDPAGTQNLTQSSAAQSTMLTVNGISVTSNNLTATDAIQGTTLNIAKVGSSTITIARDTASVTNAVGTFVKAYNDLNNTIVSLTSYDATSKQAGQLLGDSTTRQIQTQLKSMVSSSLSGLGGSLNNLTQVGITFAKDGSMALDSGKLQTAITNNYSDIASLFSSMGTTSDSLIKFVSSTTATKAGNNAINVTALASQGKEVGASAAGLTITQNSNDDLSLTIDGVSATVKLLPGTYTATTLAAQIQSAINGASAISSAGVGVTVAADNNGVLTIMSNRYGSASTVNIGGNGASNILGSTPVSTTGVDVAGTINGVAGIGSGQFLSGATGYPTEGLKIQITGGALGARGTVNFSQGYAYQLNQVINNYVGSSGSITSTTDGINRNITDIGNQRTALNARLVTIEAGYRAQFTALDTMISSMTQTQNYLTQQLAQISANTPTGK
jgi:flagellar hook-associated protein 2